MRWNIVNYLIIWKQKFSIFSSISITGWIIEHWQGPTTSLTLTITWPFRSWPGHNVSMILLCHPMTIYRVSQKKQGFVFRGHFMPLNGRKSKKVRKQTPSKIQFYLLGGVFTIYTMYIMLVSGIYCKCLLGNCMESNIKQVHSPFLQSTNWPENPS